MRTSTCMPTAPSMPTLLTNMITIPRIMTTTTLTPTAPCAAPTICTTVTDPLVPMPQA